MLFAEVFGVFRNFCSKTAVEHVAISAVNDPAVNSRMLYQLS